MILTRLTLAAATCLAPAAAMAACGGPSLLDRLSAAEEAALTAAIAATPYPEGLIWEAMRGDQRLTLIGTIHIWDPRIEALAETAAAHLDGVETALFEVTEVEQAQLLQALADDPSITTLTDGPTLPEMLDADTWALLSEAAQDRGIPPFMAAKMQPWFLATMLSVPGCAMEEIAGGQLGLDFILMEAAADRGLPMAALEPWDTFLTLFAGIEMEEQIDLLRISLIAPEMQDEMFVAMLDGYFEGRVAEIWELNRIAMERLVEEEAAEELMQEAGALMLDARNRAWIPVIEAAAAQGPTLVAAGAAHLPGEAGLLSLLEGNGWTLRRLDG